MQNIKHINSLRWEMAKPNMNAEQLTVLQHSDATDPSHMLRYGATCNNENYEQNGTYQRK